MGLSVGNGVPIPHGGCSKAFAIKKHGMHGIFVQVRPRGGGGQFQKNLLLVRGLQVRDDGDGAKILRKTHGCY